MYKSGMPPEELPKYEIVPKAANEANRIIAKTNRLLTVTAVYLAAEREDSGVKHAPVKVEPEDIRKAAELLLAGEAEERVPWVNDLVDSLLYQS